LAGGGENVVSPFAGDLPQGLALKACLEIVRVHWVIFHHLQVVNRQFI
jgi:hypothetical protein